MCVYSEAVAYGTGSIKYRNLEKFKYNQKKRKLITKYYTKYDLTQSRTKT